MFIEMVLNLSKKISEYLNWLFSSFMLSHLYLNKMQWDFFANVNVDFMLYASKKCKNSINHFVKIKMIEEFHSFNSEFQLQNISSCVAMAVHLLNLCSICLVPAQRQLSKISILTIGIFNKGFKILDINFLWIFLYFKVREIFQRL